MTFAPYQILRSDGTLLATVAPQTADTAHASITLLGQGSVGYGTTFNDNLVRMLEHFATNNVPPANPIDGQLWYNRQAGAINLYQGGSNAWSPLASQSYVTTAVNAALSGGTLLPTGVVPGSYGLSTLSVDATGRILSIATGASATQTGGTTALPTLLAIARTGGVPTNSDVCDITQTVNWVGGNGNLATALNVKSYIQNSYDGAIFVDGPGTDVWGTTLRLYNSACAYSQAGPDDSEHVALMTGAYQNLPPGGVPAGTKMAQIWARNTELYDYTNLPSSIGNTLCADEVDMSSNNVDDGNHRFGTQYIVGPTIPLASGGYPCEWGKGIIFSGHATNGQYDGFVKTAIALAVPYSTSLVDTRSGGRMDTTVSVSLTASNTQVQVANVWGFTSAGPYSLPVSSANPASITINGTKYQQVGFTASAGTTAGVITLSTPVSTTDGTAGNVVRCAAHTVWTNTGDDFAMSTDGLSRFYVGQSGGFVFENYSGHLVSMDNNALSVTGNVNMTGGIGCFGSTAPAQQIVTGSISTGLQNVVYSLLVALTNYGLISNQTTA